MAGDFKESDWKVLRQLHPIALERFAQRVVAEIQAITSDSSRSAHDRYLDVLDLTRRRRREMADAFDDMRRSTAFLRLLQIQSHRLLTDDELARFSPEVVESLRSWFAPRGESDVP
jgi:hypothetical protein